MFKTSVRVLVLSCAVVVAACATPGIAKALVSDDQEAQLGAQVKQELDKQGTKYIRDPEIVNYVKGVAEKIFVSADKDRPGARVRGGPGNGEVASAPRAEGQHLPDRE